MKLGILGAGKIVHMALPALAELGLERVYLLAREPSREKAEALCAANGWDGVFTCYDALLAADIDAVYVALPNLLHCDYAKRALLAGKHVLVEKPMVETCAQLSELRELARQRGLALMEAMTLHALPAFQAMREQLPAIGRPRLAVFNFSQRSSRYDDFRSGGALHPVFDPAQAGGALMDINVYNLQAALGLFGRPRAVRYQANVVRGIDVSGVLTLDYGDLQAVCVGSKDCDGVNGASIQGDEGYLQVCGAVSGVESFTLVDRDSSARAFTFKDRPRMTYELRVFQEAVETGDHTRLEQLLEVTAACTEIMETARRQVGVSFPGDDAL